MQEFETDNLEIDGHEEVEGEPDETLRTVLDQTLSSVDRARERHKPGLVSEEVGTVAGVDSGIVRVRGLPDVKSDELVEFATGVRGFVFNLEPREVGVVLLGEEEGIGAGSDVRRLERRVDVPVGESLLGRIVDPLGRPLDDKGALEAMERWPVERPAPPILARAPVTEPLQTGITIVDAMIPIGRGQRELIIGDRQTGKTSLAIDTILNQKPGDVVSVYCAIGQRSSSVAQIAADLRRRGHLEETIFVVAEAESPPGIQFMAPYAATSVAEYFMARGRDTLVVFDDLTQHAQAYREVSLLLRRPPGREAYPGDIFYIHSRLLERATHLRDAHGGGSLTALPIIETEAQDLSAYIPTNLISITDGQIYLSPELAQKGVLPAVEPGRSVSRVGGKTQLPAYRKVAAELRLAHSQYEELETFARFGTRLDEETRQALEHGRRVREALKQAQFDPIPVEEQIAMLLAVNAGLLDGVGLDDVAGVVEAIRGTVPDEHPEECRAIRAGEPLGEEARDRILETARRAVLQVAPQAAKESRAAEGGGHA